MASKPFEQKWSAEAHTVLLAIMVNIVTENGAVSINKHKAAIEQGLEAHGFRFSWEAVRVVGVKKSA